jgi:hypothetical protein
MPAVVRGAGGRPPRRHLQLQGKKAEAKAEYTKAYQGLDEQSEYRRLLEVKLTALGVDPEVAHHR